MAQEHHSLTRLAIALGAVLALSAATVLSGCHTSSPRPSLPGIPSPNPQSPDSQSPNQSSPNPQVPRAPPPPRENRLSPATSSLVTQARTLTSRGDFDGASSTLDRALRIEPSNPLLWIELGRVRLAESDAHQAEVCGRKALALASGDPGASRQAGRLLADALRAQQRNQEAQQIESQPFMR
jgi:cytochrome c-type biogenesis protein CcmH/NrfG